MRKVLITLIIIGLIISAVFIVLIKTDDNKQGEVDNPVDKPPIIKEEDNSGSDKDKEAEEAQRKAEEEAQRIAEEEAQKKAEEEAQQEEINVPIKGTEKYYKDAKLVKDPYDILALVNKKNVLKEDYVPDDLKKLETFAPGRQDSVKYLREEAADAIIELVKGAEEDDYEILPTSGYRSYNLQQIIFESNVKSSGSVDKANETSALPGQSEHQSGMAIDMSCESVNYQIRDSFGDTEEAAWLKENAHKYGFIIRYPKGKEDITGYTFEPWHLRYVGKDAAEYIYENDLTLEEYIENELV